MTTFAEQTGNLAYRMTFTPINTRGPITFGLQKGPEEQESLQNPFLQEIITGYEGISYSLDTTYQYTAAGSPESGCVKIYYHLETARPWELQETVTGYHYSGASPKFGETLKLADTTLAVGIPYATVGGIEERGAVAIFSAVNPNRIGGATGERWGQGVLVTGSATEGAHFGASMDLVGNDAGLFVAGAPGEDAAYIFTNDSFSLEKRIEKPSSITTTGFGGSVSILTGHSFQLPDLNYSVAVGAYENGTGEVAIFQAAAGNGWGERINSQVLRSPVAESGDLFGCALAAAGNSFLVGCPNADVASQSGRVYVYNFDSYLNSWQLSQTLSAGNGGAGDRFGKNVAISQGKLLAASNAHSGSVYIFEEEASWKQVSQISGSNATISGSFGGNGTGSRNVSIWDGEVLVGTSAEDSFYYFTTGLSSQIGEPRISFSGVSGKLFDNDGNYVNSYLSGQLLEISGNVFTGYHNYFINNVLVNSDCSYETGVIDSYYVSGTGNLSSFYIRVNA